MIYTQPPLGRKAYKEQLKKIKFEKTWPICKSVPTKYWGCSWSQSGFPTILSIIEVGDVVVGTVLAPGFQSAGECRMASFFARFIGVYATTLCVKWLFSLKAIFHDNYKLLTMSSLQRLYLSGLSIDNALQVSKQLQMLQLQLKMVVMTSVCNCVIATTGIT